MDLADSLEKFHITSPEKKKGRGQSRTADVKPFLTAVEYGEQESAVAEVGTVVQKSKKKMELKPYKENENPLPQQFGSFLSKMDEWSVNFGTVKAVKQNVNSASNHKHELLNRAEEDDDDAIPQAQWKNYLLRPKQNQHQSPKDASDLIVTASLSDLSLIPTDTFKNKEKNDFSNLSHETDPAREAKSVFKNVLKHQRSNYFRDQDVPETQAHGEPSNDNRKHSTADVDARPHTESNSDSDEFGLESASDSDSGSVADTTNLHSPSPKPRVVTNAKRLPLITPEDAGLVFDHETGLWDRQRANIAMEPNILDTSTGSFSIGQDTTEESSAQTHPDILVDPKPTDKTDLQGNHRAYPKRQDDHIPEIISAGNNTDEGFEDEYNNGNMTFSNFSDDTPLSTPKFNNKFYPRDTAKPGSRQPSSSLHQELSNNQDSGGHTVGDITNVSRMDTSYDLTKREIVSRLLEIEQNPNNWQNLYEVDLSRQSIKDSCIGLDDILPNVISLDLSCNQLISLQGIPRHVQSLNVSNNKLRSQLLHFQDLTDLEKLDISSNNLSAMQDLRITSPLSHLHELDVSNCGINSLSGLPKSCRLDTIVAKNNKLIGSIDFKQLAESAPVPWRHVTKLDVSNNRITNLKNLHCLTSLRVLILDGNSIEHLHSGGSGNPSLRCLSVKNGRVPLHSFTGFPHLRILRITAPIESDASEAKQEEALLTLSERYPLPAPLELLEIIGVSNSSPRRSSVATKPQKRFFGNVAAGTAGAAANSDYDDSSSASFTTRSLNGSSQRTSLTCPWEAIRFPLQLRRVTMQNLGLTRIPRSISANTALTSLDVQRNRIVSATALLPSLPPNLVRLNLQHNPITDLTTAKPGTHAAETQNADRNNHRHKELLRLLLHWCPSIAECDLL